MTSDSGSRAERLDRNGLGPEDGRTAPAEGHRPTSISQSERVSRLEEALKPFARLAGPINGEEGRPTYLEAISGPNGTDELKLETYVGDGTRFEIMDAEDFRTAHSALNQGADDGQ